MGRIRGFDVGEALDVALELFWQRGYDNTSMQALCRAMDLQPGSVYAAFGSKRDLFAAALRRYIETVSAEAIDRINGAPSGLQGVGDYFSHLVDAMVDGKRARGCLITNSLVEFAARDPELAGLFQLHLARLQTSFAAALARARAEGELRRGAGPESAGMLVAVVQGMNVLAKSRPGRQALQDVASATLAGLAGNQPQPAVLRATPHHIGSGPGAGASGTGCHRGSWTTPGSITSSAPNSAATSSRLRSTPPDRPSSAR